MESSNQLVKRKRGRPPLYPPANQYTGVRAKNIDYVRQFLRKFLENESLKPSIALPTPFAIKRFGMTARKVELEYWKQVLTACRLLLACENVHIWAVKSSEGFKNAEALRQRLTKLGEGINEGTVRMPDLLKELDEIDKEVENDSL